MGNGLRKKALEIGSGDPSGQHRGQEVPRRDVSREAEHGDREGDGEEEAAEFHGAMEAVWLVDGKLYPFLRGSETKSGRRRRGS